MGIRNLRSSIALYLCPFILQISMNAYQMEDWVHVHRYVPTPLDHSTAAVTLDILCLHQDMPAMVRRIFPHIPA